MDRAMDRDSDMERNKNIDVDMDPSEIYAERSDTQRNLFRGEQSHATVPLSFLPSLVFILQAKTAIIKNLLSAC
jgi:hypothetical protein